MRTALEIKLAWEEANQDQCTVEVDMARKRYRVRIADGPTTAIINLTFRLVDNYPTWKQLVDLMREAKKGALAKLNAVAPRRHEYERKVEEWIRKKNQL